MKISRALYGVSVFIGFILLTSCHQPKNVTTSFYYWKTVYKNNPAEAAYLRHFNTRKLYVRIMDVDTAAGSNEAVPVSPIVFKNKLPDTVQLVPVVFMVNDILKNSSKAQLDTLAVKLVRFVIAKAQQAGKSNFNELQIDCDWTATTRANYFYLLTRLKANQAIQHKILSATLRLHQLKNQAGSGIPPVNRVMLMCYNMGDLRKYGTQNSILEISELKKYLGTNISHYPLPVDVGLPLFSWAVVFRNMQYTGISKRIKIDDLDNKNQFIFIGNSLYKAVTDLPQYGLNKGDEVRWEAVTVNELVDVAKYIAPLIKTDIVNIIYFHLDEAIVNTYKYEDLEKVSRLLR